MARVLVLSADLLFGSQLHGALSAAGNDVQLVAGEGALRDALLAQAPAVLVVDLTAEPLLRVQQVTELREEGFLGGVPLLGYYSHVEPGVRDLALGEGFDSVVPRSRIAREAAALVTALAGR